MTHDDDDDYGRRNCLSVSSYHRSVSIGGFGFAGSTAFFALADVDQCTFHRTMNVCIQSVSLSDSCNNLQHCLRYHPIGTIQMNGRPRAAYHHICASSSSASSSLCHHHRFIRLVFGFGVAPLLAVVDCQNGFAN